MPDARFRAVLESEEGSATFVRVPIDVRAVFGRARPRVRGTINGTPFRTTVAVYGGRYYLPVNRALREAADALAGETVAVELSRDEDPRTVDVPAELADVLAERGGAREAFDRLSYTHRKEYTSWVAEAKRPETRRRRAEGRGDARRRRTARRILKR